MGSNVTIIMSQRGLVLAAGSAVAGALFSVLRCSESTSSPKETTLKPSDQWMHVPQSAAGIDRLVIGIDLGATTINVGLFNFKGTSYAAISRPIDDWDFEAIIAQIASVAAAVLETANVTAKDVACIGIGAPGLINTKKGIVNKAANFTTWLDEPITEALSTAISDGTVPVVLLNDAEAALQGEVWNGVALGKRHVVMLTLGSGIGGGVMIDGRVVRGCSGYAGELGHAIIKIDGRANSGTGVCGVAEEYASCGGIKRHVKKLIDAGQASSLLMQCAAENTSVPAEDPQHVYKAAALGDQMSIDILNEVHEVLGVLCINVCRFYDPEVIVLSGGLANAGDALLEPVRAAFTKHHWNVEAVRSPKEPRIVRSKSTATSGAAFGALQVLYKAEFAVKDR